MFCHQAIRTGWVHPNINLENPDEGVVCCSNNPSNPVGLSRYTGYEFEHLKTTFNIVAYTGHECASGSEEREIRHQGSVV